MGPPAQMQQLRLPGSAEKRPEGLEARELLRLLAENNICEAFAQVAVTPRLTLQGELRRSERGSGDLDTTLDDLDPSFRQEINQDSARSGAHYQPSVSHDLLACSSIATVSS